MVDKPCYSPLECDILQRQIERRAKYRKEFLKKRSDPCQHSKEAGFVFDDAMQRFIAMKVTQLDNFQANTRTSLFGTFAIVVPMLLYGSIMYMQRSQTEEKIRSGQIKYKDRIKKLI